MSRLIGIGICGFLICSLTGCSVTLEQFLRGMEPLIDTAVNVAANSVGMSAEAALKEHLGDQWTGGEITAAVSAIIGGLYAGGKGLAFGVNRAATRNQGNA